MSTKPRHTTTKRRHGAADRFHKRLRRQAEANHAMRLTAFLPVSGGDL